jgi:mannose-6-phosphate isomerase-like protein (cupin superfamily)
MKVSKKILREIACRMEFANPTRASSRSFFFLLLGTLAFQASGAEMDDGAHSRFRIRQDNDVLHVEAAPHDGSGQTKAYRYFDDIKDAAIVFRKRSLPKGGAIGMHVLGHDEIYYVLSGRAELTVDDQQRTLQPSTAVYMSNGANVGIRQTGDEDLVLIVAYPAQK